MKAIELLKMHEQTMRQKFHVRKIGIFGSFARNEENDASDIDILVEFDPGFKTFDNYMELKYFIEDVFERSVDLVTVAALKPQLKENILREVIYAWRLQALS